MRVSAVSTTTPAATNTASNVTGGVGGALVTPTSGSGVLGASTLPSTGSGGSSNATWYLLAILGLTLAGGGLAGVALYRQSRQ